jgi:hypothetical protein
MIRILPSAKYDLARGFRFYENQNQGLGNYFLETLISEIDSLESYAGIHPIVFGYSSVSVETLSLRHVEWFD